MLVSARDGIKAALQASGVFPVARAAYRQLSGSVRRQRALEIAFYRELIRPRSLCFDVGANLGQKTEVLLACEARHVVVVEPNILCAPTLEYHFGRDGRVAIELVAIGSAPGHTTLHVHGTDSTASTSADWDRRVFGSDRGTQAISAPVVTLDGLIARYGRPDFVKIDVEGFELEVLHGLSSRLPLISLEFHSSEIKNTEACLAWLARLGPISVRAADMGCAWLGPKIDSVSACIQMLRSINAKGDLFVWSDN